MLEEALVEENIHSKTHRFGLDENFSYLQFGHSISKSYINSSTIYLFYEYSYQFTITIIDRKLFLLNQ